MKLYADTIFCDDIRQEVTGKHLLIGVYSGQVLVHEGPSVVPISTWMKINGIAQGKHEFSVTATFESPGREPVPSGVMSGNMDVADTKFPFIMVFPPLPIGIEYDGELKLELTIDGLETVHAGTVNFVAAFRGNAHTE